MSVNVGQIEKLNGENYAIWTIQLKSLLVTLDQWSAISESCPDQESKKVLWQAADQKALATILLSVKPSELVHIKNCVTAKGAWDILQTLYKTHGPAKKVMLFKSLMRFKFDKNEKFSSQLNRFCEIIEELKEIDIQLSDDLLSIILLCSLPQDMDSFVVAVETRDSLPTLKQLIAKILDEERRQSEKTNEDETVLAVTSWNERKNENTNTQRQNKKKVIKCYACGKRGHMRALCRKQKAECNSTHVMFNK